MGSLQTVGYYDGAFRGDRLVSRYQSLGERVLSHGELDASGNSTREERDTQGDGGQECQVHQGDRRACLAGARSHHQ